jgi:hypothetical protein
MLLALICQNRRGPRNPQAGGYGKTWLGPIYVAGAFAFTNNWFNTNHFGLGDQITASSTARASAGAWKVVIATSCPQASALSTSCLIDIVP